MKETIQYIKERLQILYSANFKKLTNTEKGSISSDLNNCLCKIEYWIKKLEER
jgi:hypothetical protein